MGEQKISIGIFTKYCIFRVNADVEQNNNGIMSAVQEQQILKTLRSFGYSDVWDFALKQAQILVSEKIAYYQSRIDYYEAKYGMNYATFCAQFHQIAHPALLEREDDGTEWDAAIAAVRAFSKDKLELLI